MLEENQPDGNRCESPGRVARKHNTESTGTSELSLFFSLFFLFSLHCNIYIYNPNLYKSGKFSTVLKVQC